MSEQQPENNQTKTEEEKALMNRDQWMAEVMNVIEHQKKKLAQERHDLDKMREDMFNKINLNEGPVAGGSGIGSSSGGASSSTVTHYDDSSNSSCAEDLCKCKSSTASSSDAPCACKSSAAASAHIESSSSSMDTSDSTTSPDTDRVFRMFCRPEVFTGVRDFSTIRDTREDDDDEDD